MRLVTGLLLYLPFLSEAGSLAHAILLLVVQTIGT